MSDKPVCDMTPAELREEIAREKGWDLNWSDPLFRSGRVHWNDPNTRTVYLPEHAPDWPTCIDDAWALVEEMVTAGCRVGVYLDPPDTGGGDDWACGVCPPPDGPWIQIDAPTPPLAICRAWVEWKRAQ